MTTLIVSQTIFYIVSSVTIIVIGVFLGVMIYYIICILRNTSDLSKDVIHTYNRAKRGINKVISSFSKKYSKK